MLKDNKLAQHVPTLHPTSEELTLGNINFTTFDLGGHAQGRFIMFSHPKLKFLYRIFILVRKVWKEYFPAIDAIVFLIDAWDRQRFNESYIEFESILNDEQLSECPILILGNKIDKNGACGENEIRHMFRLNGRTTGKVFIFSIFRLKFQVMHHLTIDPSEFNNCTLLKVCYSLRKT